MTRHLFILCTTLILFPSALQSAEQADVAALLKKEIISPRQTRVETEEYTDPRVPRLPEHKTPPEWQAYAKQLRADVLKNVVFRGEAAKWRDARTRVQWLKTIECDGYRIKKLRYEAVPGLWIPALLYEPSVIKGKVPVVMNVNGHDGKGKVATYKQTRCINQVKRGMLALNVEWLGMGQLRTGGFSHARMNQLDLCGTSGLAPFYLSMKRGLDVLLAHPHADPKRVGVAGLSGGGWQTIFISSLDERVTLSNPVAGYSSFRTRIRHHKDLGDSEQTPCDLATVADYSHLTAMLAPRPALLTYNAKDNCCFEAGYALPPLMQAAQPVYKMLGKEKNVRSHVNVDPGNHNFEKDNRQALYRMMRDHWYPDDKSFSADEIDVKDELKTAEELTVAMPNENADFNQLALSLSKTLPLSSALPKGENSARYWQSGRRRLLRKIVKAQDYKTTAVKVGAATQNKISATYWKLHLDKDWTVPVVEMTQGEPVGTTVLIHDGGRSGASAEIAELLKKGQRVVAADVFYFGECKIDRRGYLFALLLSTIGDRPLGLQASQLAAVMGWAKQESPEPVSVAAHGTRSSLIALTAVALDESTGGDVELHGSMGSLKEIIERNRTVSQEPEQFCFGLLERFDVLHLAALAAPRKVRFVAASERARKELVELKRWYATLGVTHDPLR